MAQNVLWALVLAVIVWAVLSVISGQIAAVCALITFLLVLLVGARGRAV